MIEEENSSRYSSLFLQERELSYRLLVESVRDYAIFMLDTTGRIVTWNIGAERIKGYKAKEIIGKHFSAFYPPEVIAAKYPEYELRITRFWSEFWGVPQNSC